MFKAENFNADEWADLCVMGGAKFFTMMGVHHDSFCLWDTKLSKWNSVNMGPKRNLVGEMETAVRKRGLKFGVSNHSAWNYSFFQFNHINGYDAKDPAFKDLYGTPIIPEGLDKVFIRDDEQEGEGRVKWLRRSLYLIQPSERDMNRWLARTKELADMYHPDLYYFDWGMNPPKWESRRKEFAAHYYNNAIAAGQGAPGDPGVVINYKFKNVFKDGSAVRDIERGGMDEISDMVWQTCDCVYDDHNWGYVPGVAIKPTNTIIDQLMDTISKRGVLMLSFAPKADGSFPEDQKQMMRELGAWLKINGEAVYATRPYVVFGETGSKTQGADPMKIRFTRNKANTTLYATALTWPGDTMLIKTLAAADLSGIKSVRLLGIDQELKWTQTEQGLEISMPQKPGYGMAYPVRIQFDQQISAPQLHEEI